MKKPQVNYAFIDGTNLHRTMLEVGWNLDYQRFRVYLREHYGIAKAYWREFRYASARYCLATAEPGESSAAFL